MTDDTPFPAARKALPRRLRFEILRRDGHTCRYCGAAAPDVKLTVDHVIPVVLGGSDDPTNLVTACVACNGGKSATSPDQAIVENVASDALRWAAAMKQAAEIQRQTEADIQHLVCAVATYWYSWKFPDGSVIDLPGDADQSIRRLIAAGQDDEDDLMRAVEVSMRSGCRSENVFRYFCGVCWNIIRDRQDMARKLLAEVAP